MVVRRYDVRFSLTRLQYYFIPINFENDPILVNFVRVKFAMGRRGYVFRPRSRREAVFFPGVDYPVVRLKRTDHVDVPALSNACNLRRFAKPLPAEAFFNAVVSGKPLPCRNKPVVARSK
jgi:hypothetical protein